MIRLGYGDVMSIDPKYKAAYLLACAVCAFALGWLFLS